jgi:hypothetical protein
VRIGLVSGFEGADDLPASRITSEYALVVLAGRRTNSAMVG